MSDPSPALVLRQRILFRDIAAGEGVLMRGGGENSLADSKSQ